MERTARKAKSRQYNLQEIAGSLAGRVDRDKHVVHGVKMLGLVSKNRARYSEKALASSANLYEGTRANFDHPDSPTDAREYGQKLGTYRNVKFRKGQGLFGDLHYNPKHNLIEQFLWDAENDPASLGLSPNHRVRATVGDDGWKDVHEINLVRSVDVVPNPGTTLSLYEHEDAKMTTNLTSLLRQATPHSKKLLDLLEMEGLNVTSPIEVAQQASPAEAVEEALTATVVEIFKDPAIEPTEVGTKVADLAQIVVDVKAKIEPEVTNPLDDLTPDGEAEEVPEDEEAPADDAPADDAPADAEPSPFGDEAPAEKSDSPFPPKEDDEEEKTESAIERALAPLVKTVKRLEHRDTARGVLEARGVPTLGHNISDLMECRDEKEMIDLVESWPGRRRGATRPAINTVARTERNGAIPKDQKARIKRYLQN